MIHMFACLDLTSVSRICGSSVTLIIIYILSAYGVNLEGRILYDVCKSEVFVPSL